MGGLVAGREELAVKDAAKEAIRCGDAEKCLHGAGLHAVIHNVTN